MDNQMIRQMGESIIKPIQQFKEHVEQVGVPPGYCEDSYLLALKDVIAELEERFGLIDDNGIILTHPITTEEIVIAYQGDRGGMNSYLDFVSGVKYAELRHGIK